MKTEVILTHNIVGLGGESDQVRVAAGYARNYLLPQRLAIPVTSANKRHLEALKKRRAEREAHEFNSMTELAKGVSKLICMVKVKTGEDGKMFGTVTTGTIADELKHQFDISLDKRKIHLEHPIRILGDHDVELHLHQDVNATLKVRVESSTALPPSAETPAMAGRTDDKGDRRGRRQDGINPKTDRAVDGSGEARDRKPKDQSAERSPKAERPARAEKPQRAEKPARSP